MIAASLHAPDGRTVATDVDLAGLRRFVDADSGPAAGGASHEPARDPADGTRPPSDDAVDDGARFAWLDLDGDDEEGIAAVAEIFDLPVLAVEDAVTAHQRAKLERYGDVLFLIVKPVASANDELEISELAVFVGERFVITVRHGVTSIVGDLRRDVVTVDPSEVDGADAASMSFGPVWILHQLLDLVVDDYEQCSDRMEVEAEEVEAQVFGPSDSSHAEPIYLLKRRVAALRRVLLPLGPPLQRVVAGSIVDLPEGVRHRFRDVLDHLQRSAEAVEAQDRLLTDVLQADLAKVGVRQNEISLQQNEDQRKMSAWAAIALLPTAVGGLYGMNFRNMPELDWTYSYPVVLGLIALGCFLLHRNFRRRGWL